MFDPNSPLPKYHQLKKYLQQKIRQGELAPGQQIDTENYLAKQFNLSRQTVRQALGDLEKDGWIIRQQGRGTFVADRAAKKSG
ncbi:MAG: GntR family transcriptional regulator, partial [Firmicutes bacterium]|nr:GntR family transcriptional regulator [Bacillota bacterium]